MMNKLKVLTGKLTGIRYTNTIIISAVILLIAASAVQDNFSWKFAGIVILIGICAMLQISIGTLFFKILFSGVVVVYSTSMYTSIVMETSGNAIEPFLMTMGFVTFFLGLTYSDKNSHWVLRSKPLWSSILAVTLVSVKSAFILNGFSLKMAELMGLYYFILFMLGWFTLAKKGKKTRMEKPSEINTYSKEGFKIIEFKDEMELERTIWKGYKSRNAKPFIYNEVLKAKKEGLHVIFVSNGNSNKEFSINDVVLNRTKKIPYVYLEDKNGKYLDSTISFFKKELELFSSL